MPGIKSSCWRIIQTRLNIQGNSSGLRISPVKVLNFIKKQKFVAVIQVSLKKLKK